MTDIFEQKLMPSTDAIASAVGDETVILQLKNGTYFGLDPVGTRVWELLQDGAVPAALCGKLVDEFEVEPEVLEADVRRLVGELEANELITPQSHG